MWDELYGFGWGFSDKKTAQVELKSGGPMKGTLRVGGLPAHERAGALLQRALLHPPRHRRVLPAAAQHRVVLSGLQA